MIAEYAALATRIRQILLDLDRVTARAESLFQQYQKTNDDGYLDGVALNLHGFYSGVERIFEDIARTVDRSMPTSAEWHRDLLLQMADEVSTIRPAVINLAARRCLDEYRGFRHLVRNIYTFNLRPSRLQELITDLPGCYITVKEALLQFITFLEAIE
ncbi:MAG: hypothetical protein KF832_06475 [Caldilineaceae bacterium]|nr:hypothetical protein [Caldilineaceae bacterium]